VHHEAYQGEDQWMDMLDAQEQRMKAAGHDVRSKSQKDADSKERKQAEQAKAKKDEAVEEKKRSEAKS